MAQGRPDYAARRGLREQATCRRCKCLRWVKRLATNKLDPYPDRTRRYECGVCSYQWNEFDDD